MKDSLAIKRSNGTFSISQPTPSLSLSEKHNLDNMNTCNALKVINRRLIRAFYNLGYNVAIYPIYFIIIPLIVTFVLMTGIIFIKYEENPLILFVPYTAPFLAEQRVVELHFPIDYSQYYNPSRFTRHEGHSRIIITAKDDQSILRPELWPEIMELDEIIKNVVVMDEFGDALNYTDVCSKWRGYCIENTALNLEEIIYEVANGSTVINYPIMVIPLIFPQVLGGVTINRTGGTVDDAKAISLGYFVQADTPSKYKMAIQWEQNLLNQLRGMKYDFIRVSFYTSRSLGDELKAKMDSSLPYIPLTAFIMVSACIGLLWMSDCVKSKPLIGVVGVFSSGMAAGAAFGFLMYCGAIYTRLNVVALFLVLGIGVDDIFVAIAAWQKTNHHDTVPKRLAQTYSDAAVSVTITSLTNALAFAVGTSTPTVIVQNFCLYCGVTIVFAYLFFITFCGGFLALAGYAEKQGRHSLFLVKVKPAPEKSSALVKKFYSVFCMSASLKDVEAEPSPHIVSIFFRDYVGSLLINTKFKIVTVISVILYLIGAIYGLSILKEGLYRHRMSRDDSYLVEFSKYDELYFRHLPYMIQTVITGNITYSDEETQNKLIKLERDFEALPHGSEVIYTRSWLRSFKRRLERRKPWKDAITDEVSFIKVLREKFFANPDNDLALDVEFNEDYTRIIASRAIFQAGNVSDVYDDVRMMNNYRNLAKNSEFNVTTYNMLFSLFDQHSMMKPLAIQSILIGVVLVMIVALLFIPDAWGSVAIACSILSIASGVIGYMAFWNINLDHVSAGSIFMCIGFSVDFSAHITYTYASSKEPTSEGKIRESMFSLGLPIIQGGISTVLSLVTFLLIPGYGYRTFFKTIFLVTIFAAYHSIVLIPMFLSTVEDLTKKIKDRNQRKRDASSAIDSESRQVQTMDIKSISTMKLYHEKERPNAKEALRTNSKKHSIKSTTDDDNNDTTMTIEDVYRKDSKIEENSNCDTQKPTQNGHAKTNGSVKSHSETNGNLSNNNSKTETQNGVLNTAYVESEDERQER